MAGMSSRFRNAGYKKPKYMLKAHGITLFSHSVSSFKSYFNNEVFIFIVKDIDGSEFVKTEVKKLGILHYHIILLEQTTRGQAESVYNGLKQLQEKIMISPTESLTIFNIDTIRCNFMYPKLHERGDGYLEVFSGEGDNWSFVKPVNNESTLVIETAEKKPISKLCCTGLYYFSRLQYFFEAYDLYILTPKDSWDKGELYVAPLYNILIAQKKEIHYHKINVSDVFFAGVPKEYEDFCKIDYESFVG